MSKIFIIVLFVLAVLLSPLSVVSAKTEKEADVSFVVFGHVYVDYGALENSVDKVNKLNPDFIVLLGDTLPNSHHLEWDDVLRITNRFNAPIYFVPGNHDIEDRAEDKEKFIKKAGPLSQTVELGEYNFIFLNSSDIVAPNAAYDITGRQIKWLKGSYNGDKINMVFVHHCLFYGDNGNLCNSRGRVISGENNWNKKVVPLIRDKNLAVFVGDVGSKQPYFAYQENGIRYYGVGFSARPYKYPPYFLKVSALGEKLSVVPVSVYEDIAGLDFTKVNKKPVSFREKLPRFSYERLRMIMIVYLKKIAILLSIFSLVFFISTVYFWRKSKNQKYEK